MHTPRVTFAFNMKNGLEIARQLNHRGWLDSCLSVPVFSESLVESLPPHPSWVRRLAAKRVASPPPNFSWNNAYLAELALHVRVPRLPWHVQYAASERIFDATTLRRISKAANVFHYSSGIGAWSSRKAQAAGLYVICQRRALHHEVEARLVADVAGKGYVHPEAATGGHLDAEYDSANLILCNSRLTANSFVEKGFNPDLLEVVHNGVSLDKFSFKAKELRDGEPLRLLFVGSIDSRKGITTLISAVRQLDVPVKLDVIGPVREEKLARQLSDLGEVRMMGLRGGAELIAAYHQADITVLPSYADAFGYVVSESLACGTPVLVSDMCGSSEVVRDGIDGFVFKAGDDHGLAHRITEMSDRQLLGEMLEKIAEGRDRLGWSRYGDELEGVYLRRVVPHLAT